MIEDTLKIPRAQLCRRKFEYKQIQMPGQDPTLYEGVQAGCQSKPGGCAKFK